MTPLSENRVADAKEHRTSTEERAQSSFLKTRNKEIYHPRVSFDSAEINKRRVGTGRRGVREQHRTNLLLRHLYQSNGPQA